MKVNLYKIKRCISRPKKTEFFRVNADGQQGIGFQFSTNQFDYGISIYYESKL